MVHFAVSVDDADTNRKFAEHVGADYAILADPSKEVATKYGVLSTMGLASRWTFYIGPDGKILFIDKQVKPASAGPDLAARLAELKVAKR